MTPVSNPGSALRARSNTTPTTQRGPWAASRGQESSVITPVVSPSLWIKSGTSSQFMLERQDTSPGPCILPHMSSET